MTKKIKHVFPFLIILISILNSCEVMNAQFNSAPVSGVRLDPDYLNMATGEMQKIKAIIIPDNALDTKVSWSSSNSDVASVDEYGYVTALTNGSATVKATTSDGGFIAETSIEVIEQSSTVSVESVEITGELSCKLDDTIELTANITPTDATDKTVTWYSSDHSIATVTDGIVTPLSPGDVRITVKTNDGGWEGTHDMTVHKTASTTNVVFLRHSTGGWIFNYGLERDYGTENHNAYDNIYNPAETGVGNFFLQYNADNGTDYRIQKRAYPSYEYGWENYPYDYWNLWVNHSSEGFHNGQDTLSTLTSGYDVIIWKHCFPGSQIENDTGYPDIQSSRKSLENYMHQYNAIKNEMKKYPETKFIVWTSALETEGNMSYDYRDNTKTFVNWVRDVWDEPGDNIYFWDLYYLETNKESAGYNLYPSDSWDSHPTESFNNAAGPLFAQRIIDVIEDRGDIALCTGEAGPVKGHHWNLTP